MTSCSPKLRGADTRTSGGREFTRGIEPRRFPKGLKDGAAKPPTGGRCSCNTAGNSKGDGGAPDLFGYSADEVVRDILIRAWREPELGHGVFDLAGTTDGVLDIDAGKQVQAGRCQVNRCA